MEITTQMARIICSTKDKNAKLRKNPILATQKTCSKQRMNATNYKSTIWDAQSGPKSDSGSRCREKVTADLKRFQYNLEEKNKFLKSTKTNIETSTAKAPIPKHTDCLPKHTAYKVYAPKALERLRYDRVNQPAPKTKINPVKMDEKLSCLQTKAVRSTIPLKNVPKNDAKNNIKQRSPADTRLTQKVPAEIGKKGFANIICGGTQQTNKSTKLKIEQSPPDPYLKHGICRCQCSKKNIATTSQNGGTKSQDGMEQPRRPVVTPNVISDCKEVVAEAKNTNANVIKPHLKNGGLTYRIEKDCSSNLNIPSINIEEPIHNAELSKKKCQKISENVDKNKSQLIKNRLIRKSENGNCSGIKRVEANLWKSSNH
ncbi:uncharacterized protein LOC119689326 [Teleopsis dalmanni]|uniref:uncharacterized protein LOC119663497 n=1 Tax=Teleopsis dalmanni TaxID=139649 RepID=UPI0018CE61E3|nr:uncharacterized protein LOC119663497 [Teleopsis dalmanni]XP_037929362.1 uncharacterized protein LOC119663833 [Teleopsis dalmanni]XP_037934673.1 uncharacterized protein LOC119669016 [Teleopsis dalmanni]XP_037960060.1 uncharacterized protein LOC119689326 [Teleopsis dalmanni]